MRLYNLRSEESIELISYHLIRLHRDRDKDSLFVRFSELCHHIEYLDAEVRSLNSAFRITGRDIDPEERLP